jgi:phage repressor protein C with HTH and peptisase S24 domain
VHIYTSPTATIACKRTQMPKTLVDRIQQRLAETGKTAHAASIEAGGSPSLIPNILNGRSDNPRLDTLRKIALALDTSVEWLTGQENNGTAKGSDAARRLLHNISEVVHADAGLPKLSQMAKDVPVRGTAMGAILGESFEGIRLFDGEPIDMVRRPPALDHVDDAYAVFVSGDSMDPMHRPGELRFVHPNRPAAPGDTVVVVTRHWDGDPGQAYIKILRHRTADMILLEQINPAATIRIPLRFVVSVHRVLTMNELFGL